MKSNVATLLAVATLGLLAFGVRVWELGASGLQNDEQVWHARSALFVYDFIRPWAPADLVLPREYWPVVHADLSKATWRFPKRYPFTIRMKAPHPGIPVGFLMGLAYVFLGEGTGSLSLNVAPVLEVTRYPNVVFGTLLVLVLYFGGRLLIGPRAAFLAAVLAAVDPVLIGFSRVARLDLSAALWGVCAVLTFLIAQRKRQAAWAALAGLCIALAGVTHTLGLLILPVLLLVRAFHPARELGDVAGARRALVWCLPTPNDWALVLTIPLAYIVLYPNLWPNPILGLIRLRETIVGLPHVTGKIPSGMPLSHAFYLVRFPEHILPWTLALAGVGAVAGLRKRVKETSLILGWLLVFGVLISAAPGYKETKNGLALFPPLMLLAGVGADGVIAMFTARRQWVASVTMSVLLAIAGLSTVIAWWPYPRLYTWPWRPDPQQQSVREIVDSVGVKEAMAFILAAGPGVPRVGMFTGQNNAEYYYPPNRLGAPTTPEELRDYDWLVVLPKLSFGSSGDHPLVHWVRTHTPDHVIREHQIEICRLYRVGPGTVP